MPPPLPLPPSQAPFAGPTSVEVPMSSNNTVATSLPSLFNTPSPSRKAKRKTPPAKYNDQQTRTQMEHIAPPAPNELGSDDDEDNNLPPGGVETIVDASRKKVYHINVGGEVLWFFNKEELFGKRSDNNINKPCREDNHSPCLLDSDDDSKRYRDDDKDDDNIIPIVKTQGAVGGMVVTTDSVGAGTNITPDPPEFRNSLNDRNLSRMHMSQLSQLSESQYHTGPNLGDADVNED
jgi:hypothetical protein